jgi:hypothetical protein
MECDFKVNPGAMSQDVFFVNNGQLIDGVGIDNKMCNFYNAQRSVFAGTQFGSSCERDIRTHGPNGYGISGPMIISHNTHPPSRFRTEANLDIRGAILPSGITHQYMLISDSVFATGNTSVIVFTSCCVGAVSRQGDVIIERNRALAAIGYAWINNRAARRLTVRNNVIAAQGAGLAYKREDCASSGCDTSWPRDNHIVNNSVYSSVDVSPFRFNGASDPNSVCQNNIYYSTAGNTAKTCNGASTESGNASRSASDSVRLTSNPFVGAPAATGAIQDWELNAAPGGGLSVMDAAIPLRAVQIDFLLRKRPSGSGPDIGGLETQSGPAAAPLPPVLLSN